jgi:biotin carboxyl carrier protein
MSGISQSEILRVIDAISSDEVRHFRIVTEMFDIALSADGMAPPIAAAHAGDTTGAVKPSASAEHSLTAATGQPVGAASVPSEDDRSGQLMPTGEIAEVRAPRIGIFRSQPNAEAVPFVAVGSFVDAQTTVALIEEMGTLSAATAGVDGVVTSIAFADGDFVEYDSVLMTISQNVR